MNNEEMILQMLQELKEGQDRLVGDISDLKAGQAKLETDVRHTRVLVEQQEHHIQLVAEQYGDIAEKLDKANDRAAQIDDVRARLRTLETVVMNHTAAIKELRAAE